MRLCVLVRQMAHQSRIRPRRGVCAPVGGAIACEGQGEHAIERVSFTYSLCTSLFVSAGSFSSQHRLYLPPACSSASKCNTGCISSHVSRRNTLCVSFHIPIGSWVSVCSSLVLSCPPVYPSFFLLRPPFACFAQWTGNVMKTGNLLIL